MIEVLRRWLVRWAGLVLGLLIAGYILPETIHITDPSIIPLAALALLAVQILIRPIVATLALPVSLLTLGFFSLVINTWLLMLSARLVGGFEVNGFWGALVAALVIAITGGVVEELFPPRN